MRSNPSSLIPAPLLVQELVVRWAPLVNVALQGITGRIFIDAIEKYLELLPGQLPSKIVALAKKTLQEHVDILLDDGIADVMHGLRDGQEDRRHDKSPIQSPLGEYVKVAYLGGLQDDGLPKHSFVAYGCSMDLEQSFLRTTDGCCTWVTLGGRGVVGPEWELASLQDFYEDCKNSLRKAACNIGTNPAGKPNDRSLDTIALEKSYPRGCTVFPKGSYQKTEVPTRAAVVAEDVFVKYASIFGFAVVRCEIVTQTLRDVKSVTTPLHSPPPVVSRVVRLARVTCRVA